MLDRIALTVSLTFVLASLSGCNSGGDAPAQTGDLRPSGSVAQPPQDPPAINPPAGGSDGGTDGQGSASVGPSCASSDATHQCISLKIVSYEDSSGTPSLTKEQAVAMLAGVNSIWQPCNIAFEIGEYVSLDPTTVGLTYGAGSQNELGTIRQKFSNDTTFLLAATGPWSGSYIAWTEMPGGAPYGSIVDAQYAADKVAVGHELGHYMGQDHSGTSGNVMYPIVYSSDTSVTSTQCSSARATNAQYWQAMLR